MATTGTSQPLRLDTTEISRPVAFLMILARCETVEGEASAQFRSGYSHCKLIPYFHHTCSRCVLFGNAHFFSSNLKRFQAPVTDATRLLRFVIASERTDGCQRRVHVIRSAALYALLWRGPQGDKRIHAFQTPDNPRGSIRSSVHLILPGRVAIAAHKASFSRHA